MKRNKRSFNDPNQAELFAVVWMPYQHPFRLCAGDVIRFDNRLCRVIRVNDCAAVVIMNQPVRRFKTRFDKPVSFQPPPAMFRICSNSDVEILNRKRP
jgi:hypothetical protein